MNFSDLTHFASAYFSTPDEPAYRIKYDIGATQVTNYYSLPVSDGEIGFRDLITFATGYTLSNERSQPASLQETPVQATLTELERQNGKHLYELSLGGVQADLRAFSLTLQGGKVRDLIPQNALETDLTFLMHGVIGDSDSTKVDVGLIGKGDAVGYDQTVLQIVTDGRVNLIESVFADEFGHLIHAEVSVEELPDEFDLYQNYPNPFNPATTIRYDLPENTDVRLEIFNILGQRVYTLVDAPQKAGRYEVRFDAGRMARGVYFYRLRTGAFASVKQMTLIK